MIPGVALSLALFSSGACAGSSSVSIPIGGSLAFECQPKTAQIFVDDRYHGTVMALRGRPLPMPIGLRRIELRQKGYYSSYHEVTVVRGVRQKISVVLQKELL